MRPEAAPIFHQNVIKKSSARCPRAPRAPRRGLFDDFWTTFGRLLKIAESAAAEDLQRTFIHFGDAISVEEPEVINLEALLHRKPPEIEKEFQNNKINDFSSSSAKLQNMFKMFFSHDGGNSSPKVQKMFQKGRAGPSCGTL